MLSSIPTTHGQARIHEEAGGVLWNMRGRRRRHHSQGIVIPEDQVQTRIIGGGEVDPFDNRYPYFAAMRETGICGGVLISPSIVLTAAHCEPTSNTVRIGMESLDQRPDSISIAEKVIHPLYGSMGYSYDAMLMKLDSPSDAQYIMLNLDANVPVADQELWVLGFGDTAASDMEQVLPTVLNEVDVQYITQSDCATAYGDNLVQDDMMCAASNGKDACAGDSGGPLIIKGNSPAEDVLVGTVAWGVGCADARYPGVYSRTSYFLTWIIEQVCLLSPEDAPAYMACNSEGGFTAVTATAAPVPAPTNQPSAVVAVSNPVTIIKFMGWNPQRRGIQLDLCQGDCDSSLDCVGGLICARALSEQVQNYCQFDPNDKRTNFDVCIYP